MDRPIWPTDPVVLEGLQFEMGELEPDPWVPFSDAVVAGCFVCFEMGGEGSGDAGDAGWSAAAAVTGRRRIDTALVDGHAGAPYMPGLLAAREGALLESAVALLSRLPDVILVNATGRDHPRRAGLALHLGWALDLPSVGVTHRPLLATGDEPGPSPGDHAPLLIEGVQVGWWLRTRANTKPLAISPGWRTRFEAILEIVMGANVGVRTPEPIREARRLARTARSAASRRGRPDL